MDSFLATGFAAVAGVVLLTLAVAGVPDEAGIALIVGGALVLAPTVAVLAGCGRNPETVLKRPGGDRRADRHG